MNQAFNPMNTNSPYSVACDFYWNMELSNATWGIASNSLRSCTNNQGPRRKKNQERWNPRGISAPWWNKTKHWVWFAFAHTEEKRLQGKELIGFNASSRCFRLFFRLCMVVVACNLVLAHGLRHDDEWRRTKIFNCYSLILDCEKVRSLLFFWITVLLLSSPLSAMHWLASFF